MVDAARAKLLAYQITSVSALLREIGWGPAHLWRQRMYDRLAVRTAAVDPRPSLHK